MNIKILENSICWNKSYALTLEIYNLSTLLPKDETYGLKSQMRRAAISIPSNIAEGLTRNSRKEFAYFLRISKGSCAELSTQIMLAYDLQYISKIQQEKIEILISEIMKILHASIKTLQEK